MHEACTTTENPEDMASVIIGYEINLAAYFKTPFDKSFREREREIRCAEAQKRGWWRKRELRENDWQ